ncbi:aaa family ATPase [Apodospora peruviana]|uniref:Aaa family ATPase n=1 Tax=Apodospora peruviana TaxID=516989 RepID=A0AAE0MBL3_9PEZI|nr:aaa family ATPase [Apodospora peruviana]
MDHNSAVEAQGAAGGKDHDSIHEETDQYGPIHPAPKPLPSTPIKVIPRVRKCGAAHYKNKFSPNENLYAVDVLESELPDAGPQLEDELKLRQVFPRKRSKDKVKTANLKLASMQKPRTQGFHFGPSGRMFVLRIRIQSPAILRIMSRIMTAGEETWETKPRTFLRPFSALLYYHARIREVLAGLQERWGGSSEGTLEPLHAGTRTPSSMAAESEHDGPTGRLAVDDCPDALADLRAYVRFMDEEVVDFYTQFDHLSSDVGNTPAKVRFQDLYYLFRVGELIFRPVGTGANKELGDRGLGNRTWRCYGTRPPTWTKQRTMPGADHRNYAGEEDGEITSFGVECYCIDYTGEEFCVITETFEIQPFKGEKPIKSLKVFPFRFADNHKEYSRLSLDLARRFLQSTKVRHGAYNGWSITKTTKGGPTTDVEGNELRRPEFIDSEVIVDFVEAFQTCPAWKPEAVVVKPEEPIPKQITDEFSICWWSDGDRTKLVRETSEILVLGVGVTTHERNANLSPDNPSRDKFLVRIRENDRDGKPTTEADLCQDESSPRCDLPLIVSRVFAYVLRDRKFAQLDIGRLSFVKKSSDAFQYLKIKQDHKTIIQSLVEQHFARKSSDRQGGGVDISSIDLIKGKGKGLFILLHGVPGVGKTATAEAIAAANGKPLFPITCGDLGLTPTEVEAALLRIFRLADTWNCVLLLDEVDTFFSQRARGDAVLAKNAVVSVFLRVLEYYDGLLFLTTNRPGAIDEAFKSRIHLKLYYPSLTLNQTMEIWEMNIERLEKIEQERCVATNGKAEPLKIMKKAILRFAEEKFASQKGTRWNGRQIRNAFQVASSLAHYDSRKHDKSPRLTVSHFDMIHSVTEDFDMFMHETIGKTDAEQAFERGDRADHWEATSHQEVDYYGGGGGGGRESDSGPPPPQPRSPRPGFGDGRRRRSSFNRSPSRGLGSGGGRPSGGGGGGGGGIFANSGSSAAAGQQRPQQLAGFRNPSIEVTDTRGGAGTPRDYFSRGRRDSERSEPNEDSYLSPPFGGGGGRINPLLSGDSGWRGGASSGSRKHVRDRSESKDAQRQGRSKRPKSDSDEEEDEVSE